MREGIEALQHMLDHGIKLYPCRPDEDSGKYKPLVRGESWQNRDTFSADIDVIEKYINGAGDERGRGKGEKIKLFRFIPKDCSFLCFDIDRGHNDGKDGLAALYNFFEQNGKSHELLPETLQNIEKGSFPCYVATPSGGFHLYFKYCGNINVKSVMTAGVEVKYGSPGITSPGSYKHGVPYVLHGNLNDAPNLCPFIKELIEQPKHEQIFVSTMRSDKKKPISWDLIRKWVDGNGPYAGRNSRCFAFAKKASRYGFSEQEIFYHLKSEPDIQGLPQHELKSTVRSAFGYRRRHA